MTVFLNGSSATKALPKSFDFLEMDMPSLQRFVNQIEKD